MADNTENEENPINDDKPQFTVVKELAVSNQADEIINSIPEVTESAIHAHTQQQVEIEQTSQGLTDKNGEPFSPDKHQVDSDGNPKLSAKNKLMLKRGRKSGSTASPVKSKVANPSTQGTQIPCQDEAHKIQHAQATGKVSAHLLINMSMMIGGSDFAPQIDPKTGVNEKEALEAAFTDYYISTGKVDLPPSAALAITVAMYALPRFMLPNVQTRVKAGGGRIYTWWQNRKLKKQLKKQGKTNGAQSDTGNDGKRENDTSETISAGLQA